MNRRNALKNIGFSVGSLTVTPALASIFQSCQSEIDWKPSFFSLDQKEIVEKFLELIIPESDGIPGASELKLIRYIDSYASLAKKEDTYGIQNVNSLINNTLISNSKSSVYKLTFDECENQLKKFLLAEGDQIKEWDSMNSNYWSKILNDQNTSVPEEAMAYVSLVTLRQWAVSAYRWHNEYIAKNVLDFRPVPGEQKGCVDLQEATGGLVWAVQ
ncbi:MAG: hypothetical protein ACI914_000895 [Candidatus Marivariicella framensis]|jgi:hypothetical protein|tara:strand:+ start:184 stop:828 length:645 start_codon:yes stop_codon:yes gene_type:complete